MRDCRLECVQAVIERQKRMPAEANDDRLFLDRQHRRSRFLWSRPSVHDRAARLPLAHHLLIDAVTSGERSPSFPSSPPAPPPMAVIFNHPRPVSQTVYSQGALEMGAFPARLSLDAIGFEIG